MRELDARKHIRFDDADNEEVSTATTTTTPREQDIEAENEELYGNDNNAGTDTAANRQEPSEPKTEKSKKRKAKADRKSSKKKRKSEQGAEGLGAQDEEGLETVLPARQAARPQGEMFKSLLERPAGKKGGKGA
ncbi:hypothetical protein M011DRAFT_463229 [Sporormia fimetaria CBS 119925]|uniref:Uncharacterized protein n=1 Tax=Sporormia fimetaria CBS 119925 TaxID=1340428 RepID=A0A6A6VPL1_9PLEO|nr:hypothetical protein M011DRAFT_463229 [Sporormia fimetaria CBS 119925]